MTQLIGLAIVCSLILLPITNPSIAVFISEESSTLQTGPYLDEVLFVGEMSDAQRLTALTHGEIDIDNDFRDSTSFSSLPDEVLAHNRIDSRFIYVTINCEQYPLNISGLRRAFALAFNKTEICEGYLSRNASVHDSLVPSRSSWCIEDELPFHYYDANPEIGNEILNELNFSIDSETGYRLAPNGAPFGVNLLVESDLDIVELCSDLAVNALQSLHIYSSVIYNDYNIPYLVEQGFFDMVIGGATFYDDSIEWLAYEYWSERVTDWYSNQCRFSNSTYDSWRSQLLSSSSRAEIHEAAQEMQLILHYNVPRLVLYEPISIQLYRNDTIKGFISDFSGTISGQWTARSAHLIDEDEGGRLTIGVSEIPNNYNIFTSDYSFTTASLLGQIFDLLYSSLYDYGPDFSSVPDLALGLTIETHNDTPAVPNGHARYTLDIVQNATWSDGVPLTANDVSFTFSYILESSAHGNPAVSALENLISVYAPNPYRVVFEFNSESYWNFYNVAFTYIIPEHVFNDPELVGVEGWDTWNPIINASEPQVSSGPFIVSDYEEADHILLAYNSHYYFAPERSSQQSSNSTDTTFSTTPFFSNPDDLQDIQWLVVIVLLISIGSAIVIIYCVIKIRQYRSQKTKKQKNMKPKKF